MDVQTAIVSSMFDTNSTVHFSVSRKYTRFANSVAPTFYGSNNVVYDIFISNNSFKILNCSEYKHF